MKIIWNVQYIQRVSSCFKRLIFGALVAEPFLCFVTRKIQHLIFSHSSRWHSVFLCLTSRLTSVTAICCKPGNNMHRDKSVTCRKWIHPVWRRRWATAGMFSLPKVTLGTSWLARMAAEPRTHSDTTTKKNPFKSENKFVNRFQFSFLRSYWTFESLASKANKIFIICAEQVSFSLSCLF